jgi:5-methylcytosine-specific restriction protein B
VILTGLSGSGKTKLAQAFAQWLCEDKKEQLCMVPVGADWTNREPLLGFPNALERNNYIFPETGVLSLILRALKNREKPYFLILDEMNLSHVERYFADFLSAMESGADICLHPGEEDWESNHKLKVPPAISLPPNLFIIGTVNIDETTYMFSPKVLDRANVIEFRVSREEMEKYFESANSGVQLGNLDMVGAAMGSNFVEIAKNSISIRGDQAVYKELLSFFDILKKVGAEFGYRSAAEIIRFVALVKKMIPDWTTNQIIDVVVMQKLLTKLHGSRRKLEDPLEELGQLCVKGKTPIKDLLPPTTQIEDKDNRIKYPLSFDKIKRMHQRLMDNSFTSYAEA